MRIDLRRKELARLANNIDIPLSISVPRDLILLGSFVGAADSQISSEGVCSFYAITSGTRCASKSQFRLP